jgi:hypothetical protein
MNADDIDEKTGVPVAIFLVSKQPEARTPDVSSLVLTYTELPQLIASNITKEAVQFIAGRLSGAAGLGCSDAKGWLLESGCLFSVNTVLDSVQLWLLWRLEWSTNRHSYQVDLLPLTRCLVFDRSG